MRILALVAIVAAALAGPASAVFPDRPPRIVSGYAAGGASDLIGAEIVARSAPDGYSVLQCPMSSLAITPQLIGVTVPLDPGVELMPISNMTLSSYGLVVAAGSPYRNMADILVAARARPGQVTFSSPGPGSAQHLSGELLKRLAKVDMQHIAYKGAAPAVVDIMGGRIDFMITNLGDVGR